MGNSPNLAERATHSAKTAAHGSWVAKDQQKRSTGLKSEQRP